MTIPPMASPLLALLAPVLAGAPSLELPAPDPALEAARAALRVAEGLPPHFAVAHPVAIGLEQWRRERAEGRVRWTLTLRAPGARSVNLALSGLRLPPGASLTAAGPDGAPLSRPLTAADVRPDGTLWTPLLAGGEVTLTLSAPAARAGEVSLTVERVNLGWRGLAGESADCNVDVACPEGEGWAIPAASVGFYSLDGVLACSGFMVNSTAGDGLPLFQTARHCGVSEENAGSVVVYWGYQRPACGEGEGTLDRWQAGAALVAEAERGDAALLLLDRAPEAAWRVAWAGWDRSGEPPSRAAGVHHPGLREKAISLEEDPLCRTVAFSDEEDPDGDTLRVGSWDVGTTEAGSSGSPLFNDRGRAVGQLLGGYASCYSDLADWYGALAASWEGDGEAGARLSDWLDPLGTGAVTADALAPWAPSLEVSPLEGFAPTGPEGGPFAPAALSYTLVNRGDEPLRFEVRGANRWLRVSPSSGELAPGASASVEVGLTDEVLALPAGSYNAALALLPVDGVGGADVGARLRIGEPELVLEWSLDEDPGWWTGGRWRWGEARGGAGPAAGYSGASIYASNPGGLYLPSQGAAHLESEVIDCRGLSQVSVGYWRWLSVEAPWRDAAAFSVSVDGGPWALVWENEAAVDDGEWTWQGHDLSALADGAEALRLRWTMGPTDEAGQRGGWSVDDVALFAVEGCDDSDGDGFADHTCGGEDCDDGDADASPWATERCEVPGDEDCDGRTDEGCPAAGAAQPVGCGCGGRGRPAGALWGFAAAVLFIRRSGRLAGRCTPRYNDLARPPADDANVPSGRA